MSTVQIENMGPVEHLELPIPEGGGIVVLRGRNGSGKTKTLEAVDKLTSGKGSVSVRDGALKGVTSGFGAKLTVARSATRSGTLEVESLDGKLSVADLVDPPIKDPGAADAKRIKTLVSLAGAEPDPALFHSLLGKEKFEELLPLAEADDLVALAAKIKREFEATARKCEDAAKKAHIRAEALREAIAGLDLSEDIDSEAAYSELQEATQTYAALAERLKAADQAGEKATEAREKYQEAEADYQGPTPVEAGAEANKAIGAEADAKRAVQEAERQLGRAERALDTAAERSEAAEKVHKAAVEHHNAMATWKETLDATVPEAPDAADVTNASIRLGKAKTAVEKIPAYNQAKQQQAQAVAADQDAGLANATADLLRDAAKGTDGVLSDVVGTLGTPLRVEAGRLVLDTERGATHFHELSHGERWRLGLDVAVSVAGDRTVFTIPQDAWESLDPMNRAAVAKHVKAKGITVLTAEASADEEVRPEVYGEDGSAAQCAAAG